MRGLRSKKKRILLKMHKSGGLNRQSKVRMYKLNFFLKKP